jgi:short-chain Z-isoprenyl diphosphate synthase
MTGDREVIRQYLDQLRLSLRIPETGRILVEAEDHLREAAAAGTAAGLTQTEAQQAAITGFGPVRAIVYAHLTRHGRAAAVIADLALALWRVAAFYLLAGFAVGLYELLTTSGAAACTAWSRSCRVLPGMPETTTVAAVTVWAVTGMAGVALLAAYFLVRRFQRRRGRVWSVPLGGYFPLMATVVSVAAGAGLLLADTSRAAFMPGTAVIIYAAVGLAVTYGLRMCRMLWNQARGRDELAAGMTAGTLGREVIYRLYARRLREQLAGGRLPRHVGIIMDGNRRWARRQGLADPSLGHRYGARHVENVLNWCQKAGIKHVTVFGCSTDNLANRGDAELAFLMQVIEQVIADKLSRDPAWQVHIAGTLDMLPDTTAQALKRAVEASRDCATGAHVTLAIGYGGRQEVIEAIRSLLYEHAERGTTLAELAETITTGDIARHLYTAGQPDPDLVIRTSGEQRLSNFLLWQSAYSELYFCEAYWPAFREIDFLRALRSFAARQRRYGR